MYELLYEKNLFIEQYFEKLTYSYVFKSEVVE